MAARTLNELASGSRAYEQDCHTRGGSDVLSSSLAGGWALIPPASGAEVIGALRHIGYEIGVVGSGSVIMDRCGSPSVRVPLVECLRPELLISILRTAGIRPATFIAYLDELPSP